MAGRKSTRIYRDNRMRYSLLLAISVVVLLIAVVSVRSYGFDKQLKEKNEYITQLQEQIEAEKERTVEIEEYKKYTQTRGYMEKVAKEKLGLVYEGEIVFRHE
jgi:cell division protein FtsB